MKHGGIEISRGIFEKEDGTLVLCSRCGATSSDKILPLKDHVAWIFGSIRELCEEGDRYTFDPNDFTLLAHVKLDENGDE